MLEAVPVADSREHQPRLLSRPGTLSGRGEALADEEVGMSTSTAPPLKAVLSIDGGGIRGIIPARLLREIETRMGRPIPELFDIVAGTSTGGILALGLTLPKAGTTTPAWDAAALEELYVEHGAKIFANSLLRKVETVGGLVEERYDIDELERLLRQYFGEAMLSSALTEVVVPSYDLTAPGPFFFKRSYARDQTHTWDIETWKAARATSAAPTYFDPMNLPPFEDEGEHALVDGGVFANNPTACAYAEALNLYGRGSDVDDPLARHRRRAAAHGALSRRARLGRDPLGAADHRRGLRRRRQDRRLPDDQALPFGDPG